MVFIFEEVIFFLWSKVTTTFRHSKALACESQGFVIFLE